MAVINCVVDYVLKRNAIPRLGTFSFEIHISMRKVFVMIMSVGESWNRNATLYTKSFLL